jgi:hypothetical protein
VEDLPEVVDFSPEVKREVAAGKWSKDAEREMIESLLPPNGA